MSENENDDELERKEEIFNCFNFNCFLCRGVECFELNVPHEKDPNVMGDLYFGKFLCEKVHQENDEDNLGDLICINFTLFKAVCFIVNSIPENDDNVILRETFFQSARDLKASIFLATGGYYRNSMQVLRCSFETILFGLYYYTDYREIPKHIEIKKKNDILKSYKQWKRGGVIKRIDVMNEIYRRMGLITKEQEKDWNRLYGDLSKYIHTPKSTWGKKINEAGFTEEIQCMAYNVYDILDFRIWSENFRKVYYILIRMCFQLEPSIINTEGGKSAIEIFKREFAKLEEKDPLRKLLLIFD